MNDQPASPGRIVTYTLTEGDAARANQPDFVAAGNRANAGAQHPAIVVRAWSPECANLQVFLDGPGTLWVTSRNRGALGERGTWDWPARVGA